MKYDTKYTYMSFGELFQSLIDAMETRDLFSQLGDCNMADAWHEQQEFILEEFKRRGWIK